MTIAHASLLLLLIACGNKESPKPGTPSSSSPSSSSSPAALPSTSAPTSSSAPAAPTTTAGTLVFGDATIYELVSRTWEKRDPPLKKLVMHPDGRVDTYNAKTGRVRGSLFVKADGTVTFEDGKPFAVIGEREIKPAGGSRWNPLAVDGNTIIVTIEDEQVKVILADDGNITVLDRPDGNKWRIDAKDAAVRRTAFLVLGVQMEIALD